MLEPEPESNRNGRSKLNISKKYLKKEINIYLYIYKFSKGKKCSVHIGNAMYSAGISFPVMDWVVFQPVGLNFFLSWRNVKVKRMIWSILRLLKLLGYENVYKRCIEFPQKPTQVFP